MKRPEIIMLAAWILAAFLAGCNPAQPRTRRSRAGFSFGETGD